MGGGLMQLVAYGAQDIYLTGNPQITFFKVVYRRHTNFSMESIQQTWAGKLNSSTGAGRVTATIARNGDLVNRLYIEVKNPDGSGTGNSHTQLGTDSPSKWIKTVECEIGGQNIDRQSGNWMSAWAQLTEPDGVNPRSRFKMMSAMGGTKRHSNTIVDNTPANDTTFLTGPTAIFIPLRFWFCENPGLALPLIALQYHEVKIILDTVANGATTWYGDPASFAAAELWADYIYLDTDERRRFAQVSHEYLITQIQYQEFANSTESTSTSTLTFNHPVKELIWVARPAPNQNTYHHRSQFDGQLSGNYQLKLNGHDRFADRDYTYFTRQQVWQYHSGPGGLDDSSKPIDSIAVYSFSLKPEEHQPSGTCNFSRIDNAQLIGGGSSHGLIVYAVNYNVLRIMSGMGGLAYSN